ncbi:zinc-binding dehydrogenase [Dickeya lacustris]|uniref:Zinc-binding dehydrogenase n=1 Tax=Dickeya lacustris TaxID=2259638 RepID=A0ABY8G3I6_9GAMM|nr:zinc-binding dehydrogenase [Dickeya lacustris]WFN54516.1 zinc-binding dehydrogenase [Dickeya lacustris]
MLIHAGAGGVGSFAIQFARHAGAHVIATASGDGVELARRLGAETVIDYKMQDFTTSIPPVDVVLDLVGGETQTRSYQVLRQSGRLVSTAMPPDDTLAREYGVTATMFYAKPYSSGLQALATQIAHQGVRVVIDRHVPLDTFDDAWNRLLSRQARGKITVALD